MFKQPKKEKKLSALEEGLALQLRAVSLPFVREYAFAAHHVGRTAGIKQRLNDQGLKNWRFDFAIPDKKIAIECEGGTWSGGRHTSGEGFQSDCEKYNAALLLGWKVLRYTGKHIKDGTALAQIEKIYNQDRIMPLNAALAV